MQPRFITFEGIEGVGKTTQVALAAAWLEDRGISHIVTREPGGTPLAERIRGLVLATQDEKLPPTAELLLMFAARAVHLENRILPALAAGTWVICDRFTDATYAYQGAGRGIPAASIAMLETLVQGTRQPDLTFLLDLPVKLGMGRVQRRGFDPDRFETERVEFFERVRQGYLRRAGADPKRFAVIDGGDPADEVHLKIVAMLAAMIGA